MYDLLETAAACGVTPHEFWNMTPAMAVCVIEGYHKRLSQQREDNVYFAWLHGVYARAAYHAKRYPEAPERESEKNKKEIKEMSVENMKAVMRGLSKRGR